MKWFNGFLVVGLLLVGSSCAALKNSSLTATQKAEYTTNQNLAAIAKLNLAVTKDIISLNQAGLVGNHNATVNSILNYNRLVATLDSQAVGIMQSGQPWPTRAQQVFTMFQQAKMPADVSAFLNNPSTDKTVKALISTIQTIQNTINAVIAATQTGGTN